MTWREEKRGGPEKDLLKDLKEINSSDDLKGRETWMTWKRLSEGPEGKKLFWWSEGKRNVDDLKKTVWMTWGEEKCRGPEKDCLNGLKGRETWMTWKRLFEGLEGKKLFRWPEQKRNVEDLKETVWMTWGKDTLLLTWREAKHGWPEGDWMTWSKTLLMTRKKEKLGWPEGKGI